ncbi:SHOCT domain-containing protein [Streptomyces sp. KLOTTS4A1]|uniref:SHOCT domain-containing protein n=1 Tax=Streptomyces sp. KLOTTS4A1 TaxID=3390996 RepID=UPI0039F5A679
MPQRFGRPGLLGTIARTAVISGTASAVSNRVNRGMAERDMRRRAEEEYQAQQAVQAAQAQAQAAQAQAQPGQGWGNQPAAPAPAAPVDRVAQLTALAELKAQGLLTDEEFAAEKARVLNS